jgi:hypothetical protein
MGPIFDHVKEFFPHDSQFYSEEHEMAYLHTIEQDGRRIGLLYEGMDPEYFVYALKEKEKVMLRFLGNRISVVFPDMTFMFDSSGELERKTRFIEKIPLEDILDIKRVLERESFPSVPIDTYPYFGLRKTVLDHKQTLKNVRETLSQGIYVSPEELLAFR